MIAVFMLERIPKGLKNNDGPSKKTGIEVYGIIIEGSQYWWDSTKGTIYDQLSRAVGYLARTNNPYQPPRVCWFDPQYRPPGPLEKSSQNGEEDWSWSPSYSSFCDSSVEPSINSAFSDSPWTWSVASSASIGSYDDGFYEPITPIIPMTPLPKPKIKIKIAAPTDINISQSDTGVKVI